MRHFFCSIVILGGIALPALYGQSVHAIDNGEFESLPNEAWLRDGPDVARSARGDRASIVLGANGNHYGHLGDIDGRGSNGENPSRFFQWFRCEDTTSVGRDCLIQFRFRALLLPGESAWVRVQSATHTRVLSLPNSSNQWAAIRPQIVLPGGCDQGLNYIDIGMKNAAGEGVGGRLSIDGVTYRAFTAAELPPEEGDWGELPAIPFTRDSERVPLVDPVRAAPNTDGSLTFSILILLGVGLLLIKLRR